MNQYAFKPTGSTTAALIRFTHEVSKTAEDNNYVTSYDRLSYDRLQQSLRH